MTLKRTFAISALVLALFVAGVQAQTAVQITDGPRVEFTGDRSAVVAWTTNVGASAIVRYGTDRNNLTQTAQQEWGGAKNTNETRTHRVEIKNLNPNTEYFFLAESGQAEGSGTAAKSDVMNFRTAAAGQANQQGTASIQITDGPKIEFVGDKTAVVAWTTDHPSYTMVRYGTDQNNLNLTAFGDRRGRMGMGQGPRPEAERGRRDPRNHRVEITNLQPNTTYYFVAESGHPRGGTMSKSNVTSFKTLTTEAAAEQYKSKHQPSTMKVQAGPIPQSVTDTTATLWLMTSEDAAVTVKYGSDRNNMSQTAQSPTGKQHSLRLTGLQPSTTYFFEVNAGDGKATERGQFQTENANFASQRARVHLTKGPVIEYIDKRTAIVAWSTNVRASSIVRYGTDPNNLSKTATAPWGQETHRVEIKNLDPNTKYFFVVESSQAEGTGTLAKSNSAAFFTVAEGQQAMRNPQPR